MQRLSILAALALFSLPAACVAQKATRGCAADNAGLTLPSGFCASVFADTLRGARHMWVAPNGDVVVSRQGRDIGGLVILRDADGDGVAETRVRFASGFNSSEVTFFDGYLYTENTTGILRFPYKPGSLQPAGAPDTIVQGLPPGGHFNKTFTIARDGSLYVNIGSQTNACQERDRAAGVPGRNPCVELETRAGIWKWDARKKNQTYSNGTHFAVGIRNAVGIAISPLDNRLWVTQHGRDQLADWRDKLGLTAAAAEHYSAENPAEELLQVNQGDDFGWPYCYYSVDLKRLVLAPEYGGNGKEVGQCAQKKEPVAVFPGHWAPNALFFYTGSSLPARYKNGAFIAFHGSWNRAPEPQAGFNVVFQPLTGTKPAGAYEVFATGFAQNLQGRGAGNHRPTGLAQGPDGALYVSDDAGGLIYRIVYTGKSSK